MKRIILIALAFILFQSCNKETENNVITENEKQSKLYALDISNETDWDYVVAADNKEGSSVWFNIDRTTNIPTTMFFKPFNNQDDGFTVKFKNNGLPDCAVFGDTIVVFENFKGTKCDVAVIYPNISIKYFTQIETDVNWDNINSHALKSLMLKNGNSETRIAFEHGIKFIGSALAVVGAAAVICNPAGIGIIGAITIGSAIVSIANNYWLNNMATGVSSTLAGKVVTMVGCAGVLGNPYELIGCFSGIAGFIASASSDAMTFSNSRQPLIDIAQANMQQNVNGENPNDPNDPNNPDDIDHRILTVTLTRNILGGSESHICILRTNRVAQIGNITGRWSQSGNNLGIEWALNNGVHCTYRLTGTVGGNIYRGTYTHYDNGATLYDKGTFQGELK